MSTLNILVCVENHKDFPKLSLFASWTGAMINPQWLEIPVSNKFPWPQRCSSQWGSTVYYCIHQLCKQTMGARSVCWSCSALSAKCIMTLLCAMRIIFCFNLVHLKYHLTLHHLHDKQLTRNSNLVVCFVGNPLEPNQALLYPLYQSLGLLKVQWPSLQRQH